MGAASAVTVLILIIPMIFLTISYAVQSESESRRVIDVNSGLNSVVWVVQLSDLHFSVHHPDRASDFKRLIGPALSMIKPSLVLLTGDLTDGKSKDMLTMKQDKQEWQEYRNVMENVVKRSGLDKRVFYDLRGNHDSFGVPFVGGPYDFFSNYSLSAQLGRDGRVNSVTLQTEERRHVFVGIDSSMSVGLRGPTNLFGHPTDSLLADIDFELSQWNSESITKPLTKISFGHFPISFSAASESGNTLKDVFVKHSVSAYLCGHLHASFGKNLKRLHRSGKNLLQINMHGSPSGRQNCTTDSPPIQEFWEWEMGDWRKNRAMRIVAIDKGHVSFFDTDFQSGAKKTIVVPTFPVDSRTMWTTSSLHDYECRNTEALPLSSIRALVFSVSPIASVVARIYDSSSGELVIVMEQLMSKHNGDDRGVVYTTVWNYKAYEDPSSVRYWLQIEAIDRMGRSTLSELRPFSVNGRTRELSWTWKEVMVMGCQWDALYNLMLWISLGFSVLLLLMIIYLPMIVKKCPSFLADRGFGKAGRIISELHRLNVVWFGMLVYVFYLVNFPWFYGQVFTDGGQRLYMTYKGWSVKSHEMNGKAEFAGFPDVMVVILPHIFFVVLPSILVALALAVERELYRLCILSFSGKKEDDKKGKKKVKNIRFGFHVVSRRWSRKLLMLISLAIFFKHFKSCRAISRAYEMNPLLHFPGYSLAMPLLLAYAFYETRRI